jgi:hypothetical protein
MSRRSFEEGSQLAGAAALAPPLALLRLEEQLPLNVAGVTDVAGVTEDMHDTEKGGAMDWTRRWTAIGLAAGLTTWFAAAAAPAARAAPPAVATTITTDFTSSFTAVNPCTAGTGTVAVAGRDMLHVTDFGGGIFHLVDHQTGTATFTPDDPAAVTLAGHYTTTFSNQSNPPGLQFTVGGPFNVVGTGADGSRVVFHLISRTTRLPDGTVTVSFSLEHFECLPLGA